MKVTHLLTFINSGLRGKAELLPPEHFSFCFPPCYLLESIVMCWKERGLALGWLHLFVNVGNSIHFAGLKQRRR